MVYKAALPLRRSLIMEIWPGLCSPAGWVAYRCSSVFFMLSLIAGALPAALLVAGPMDGGQGAGLLQGLGIFLASSLSSHHPPLTVHKTEATRAGKGEGEDLNKIFIHVSSFSACSHHILPFHSYTSSSCFLLCEHISQHVRRLRRMANICTKTRTEKAQKTALDKKRCGIVRK